MDSTHEPSAPAPRHNEAGQPIGWSLGSWAAPSEPSPEVLRGRHVELEPLARQRHLLDLHDALVDAPDSLWTYLQVGPFETADGLGDWIDALGQAPGFAPYAVVVDGAAVGFASYMRIDAAMGVIEIGSIGFSPRLQRTRAATEALHLMIDHVFALGYRRCEWKCDALNAPSRRAAERLGFTYEGTFRQAVHYKGRNRDTAWFSIVDGEWPTIRAAHREWLADANFDTGGRQLRSLSSIS